MQYTNVYYKKNEYECAVLKAAKYKKEKPDYFIYRRFKRGDDIFDTKTELSTKLMFRIFHLAQSTCCCE